MPVAYLRVNHFRNLCEVSFKPIGSGANILSGKNASGKTSLLEAIHFLSLGRSFRTHLHNRIIQQGATSFSLFAEIVSSDQQIHRIGIERHNNGEGKIRLNGATMSSAASSAELLPVQLIEPHSFELLEGGPHLRRQFMDWGLFHVEHTFLNTWRQYARALKQRNLALKQRASSDEIDSWSHELSIHGSAIDQWRIDYVNQFKRVFLDLLPEILEVSHVGIEYYSGWATDASLSVTLANHLSRDRMLGYTQWGPHHADLRFSINQTMAKDILSRGQQKLFVIAMKLAQSDLLSQHKNQQAIYLLDDLASELDPHNQRKLCQVLALQKNQIFLTCTDCEQIMPALSMFGDFRQLFHVEQGNVFSIDNASSLL